MRATAILLVVAACSSTASSGDRPVRVWGELRKIMHDGDSAARVTVDEVRRDGYNHAVGALSGLRGEIVIDDGRLCLEHADPALARDPEDATLLVAARVTAWHDISIQAEIPPDELDARIEALLAGAKVDLSQPIPIRIEGTTTDVHWHVVAPGATHDTHATAGPHGVEATSTAPLVGFFAGVFTHMGQTTHLHTCRGHVDRVGVAAGARLRVPRATVRP